MNQEQVQLQRLLTIFREVPTKKRDELDALAQEVDEIDVWALEHAVQEEFQADRFQLFSMSVAQVRHAIDGQRKLRR